MVRKLSIFIFVTMIFASVLFAQAQQPTKVPRIGYLTGASLSQSRPFRGIPARSARAWVRRGEEHRLSPIRRVTRALPSLRPIWCVSR